MMECMVPRRARVPGRRVAARADALMRTLVEKSQARNPPPREPLPGMFFAGCGDVAIWRYGSGTGIE